MMKIIGFQIENYRSIINSGWVDVDDLTVLVGKNESGKTSLLRALHKFRPFKPDPYVIDKEWPRGRRQSRNPEAVVTRVRFELEDAELAQLYPHVDDPAVQCGPYDISKTYSGKYAIDLPPQLFPSSPPRKKINEIMTIIKTLKLPEGTILSADSINSYIVNIEKSALSGDHSAIDHVASEVASSALTEATKDHPDEAKFVSDLIAGIKDVGQRLRKEPTVRAMVEKFVMDRIPTFIYMDDYRAFRGAALLNEVKTRKDAGSLTEEDKTLITILELSGLSIDSEFSKGQSDDQNTKEQRQYDLNDAGLSLTSEISKRWKQRKYEVEFRADRHSFFTMVRDETGPYLIPLEERSKGFQWFFSFDLMFMYESRGSFKGCVLLLDEPGLHLHANAQRDLVDRLEAYASNNTLIYTTHLPFMINLKAPSRIRTISETENGTVVDRSLNVSQPDAKLTLQSALGMSGATSYLVAPRNLVVEGVDDFLILSELSNLLIRSGRFGLPEDVHITVGGGASEAAYIATFMIGQDLDVLLLLDSDAAGSEAADKLIKGWLTRYGKGDSSVLKIGDALEVAGECAIEDLFTESYYIEKVQQVYGKKLLGAGIERLVVSGKDQLIKRVERAMESASVQFNKGSVAKLIRSEILKMPNIESLPRETIERAEKLFEQIRTRLPTLALG